jgi:diketogulonate reductase-like aldo/keto reductase
MSKADPASQTVTLPAGEKVPAFGIGTWRMGESRSRRVQELASISLALDLGVRLIDTAEMYGEGEAERIVGEAIRGRRDGLFLVSKVYPQNASRSGVAAACERSLKRLGIDCLDLYLLHWPGSVPIAETLGAFQGLREAGKIRYYGVSNFDTEDMAEAWDAPGGREIATNQVLYNLSRRGIEWSLLPWQRERRIPTMAYSPLEQARILREPALKHFASRHAMTPAQAALRWLLAQEDMIVIPKSSNAERLKENLAALDAPMTPAQIAELDGIFPRPRGSRLEML